MKKLKINKRIIPIVTYTIAIISAIGFAIYPETNAIFKKDNEKALAYTSSLDDTYKGTFSPVLNRESSTLNMARITLTLPRDNRYVLEGEKYIIEAISNTPLNASNPKTVCSIVPNSKSANLVIDADNNITFTNTENGTIDIECNVEPNKINSEDLNISIKYYEKVLEEEKFLFKKGSFTMDYNEYADPYKEPPIDSIILIKNEDGTDKSSEDIYQEFMDLLDKYYENSDYVKNYALNKLIYTNYINDNGITKTTAKDTLLGNAFDILGINRVSSKNNDGSIKGYGFIFDDEKYNFTGYVKTADFYKNTVAGGGDFIYFSTNDSTIIKESLEASVIKWAFPNNAKSYIIGDNTYTAQELIIKYIEIALNGKDYSIDNIVATFDTNMVLTNGILGIVKNVDSNNYPYLRFEKLIFDYAYNYLSKDLGRIRIDYYENETETQAKKYMQSIAYNTIYYFYSSKNINLAYTLLTEIRNTNSELNKSVTCRTGCTDYSKMYYSNGKYYEIKVNHNEAEKYNEIQIITKDNLTDLLTGSYEQNVIAGIQNNLDAEGSLLNKAITCRNSSCKEYSEVHYDAVKDEYYLIKVTPNTSFIVNNISITKFSTAVEAIGNLYNINSINASLNNENFLKNNIICTTDCDPYYEIHYNGTDYILIRVTADETNSYNTVAITKLWTPSDSTMNQNAINLLKNYITNESGVYLSFHILNIDHFKNNVLNNYLLSNFAGDSADDIITGAETKILDPGDNFDAALYYTGNFSLELK